MENQDQIIKAEQAAQLLNCSPSHIRNMAAKGAIPGRRVGSTWRFSRAKLIEFIEGGQDGATTSRT